MEQSGGLLILVLVMGGGIAYIADKVGKHLGKKRLSLFGLRPRHTAAVGTVLLGVFITLCTFATLLTLSSGVRTWVIQGPGIIRVLKDEITANQDKVRQAQQQNSNLSNANKELMGKNADIYHQLTNWKTDLQDEQKRYGDLQGRTNSLNSNISSLKEKVGDESHQIKLLGDSETVSERRLKAVRAQEKQAELNRDTANHQKNEVYSQNLQILDQNDRLTKQQAALQTEVKSLQSQRAGAQEDLKHSQVSLDEAKRELGDIEAQLGDVQLKLQDTLSKLHDAENSAQLYSDISIKALNLPVLYSKGEELARLPVRANLNLTTARSDITTLIRMARIVATRKGAKDADVYYHEDETGTRFSAQEMEQQLATQIIGIGNDQVLIACSTYNAFFGERVSLEILVKPNPIVFAAGQMIAEAPIDANKGDKVIVNEVSAFLKDKVRAKALEEGLIPPINSDVSIGEVTFVEMLSLIERIKATANRQVRLQVLAEGATRASDSLRLAFRIR